MMKKAMHRVKMAEKWKNAGEPVNPNALSLAWQWEMIQADEKAKKSYPKVRRTRVRRSVRDRVAVAAALHAPVASFENVIVAEEEKEPEPQDFSCDFESLP